MTPPLTLTAYAARRGCSVKSVSRAIAAGRLVASVGRDHLGRPTVADPELADREWDANTQRRTDVSPVRGRLLSTSQDLADEERTGNAGQATEPPAGPSNAGPGAGGSRTALPPGVLDLNTSRAVRAHALARRDTAHADLAELELARERGRLVDAEAADLKYEEHIARAKDRLLGVPNQLGQRMPDVAARVVPIATELIREALKELALDGRT